MCGCDQQARHLQLAVQRQVVALQQAGEQALGALAQRVRAQRVEAAADVGGGVGEHLRSVHVRRNP